MKGKIADLDEYRKKRDFGKTPEPEPRQPAAGSAGGIFVVHKHAASHLHYDFRLEMGGVLKSWAVPKGPSLDPSVKRLAMHVEDHPLDYAGFEGTIPEGQYGAGTVMIWDSGYWTPEGDPSAMYEQGALKFILAGKKLHGGWALIRLKRPREEGRESWLLIKEKDGEASGERDILKEMPDSAATGRSMDEIASREEASWTREGGAEESGRLFSSPVPGARPAPDPPFIQPQLATLVKEVPDGGGWLNEIKLDGYRLLSRINAEEVKIFTRKGNDWTARFPKIADALKALPVKSAWVDGEAVIMGKGGVSDFQALQNALGRGDDSAVIYLIFDLLYLNGDDIRQVPLRRRKELLSLLLSEKKEGVLRYSGHVEGNGGVFFRNLCGYEAEGAVSKRADSPYVSGRTTYWLKAKCRDRQEFVIGGFTDPEGSRSGFGALLAGLYDKEGRLFYKGRVGTGFGEKTLASVYEKVKALEQTSPPFADPPSGAAAKGVHWARPELVAEVEYAEITSDGLLRQASFKGLREDKPAREVTGERPRPVEEAEAEAAEGGGEKAVAVRFTNPDRIYYSGENISKAGLAEYYRYICPRMMPHLSGRPLTLVRCPEGQEKECFFQKHANETVPAQVKRIRLMEDGEPAVSMMADSEDGLMALVQMGVLEVHTWNSRYEKLEYPDRVVFDLDPAPGLPWERLAEGALLLRNRLLDEGLESFLKTTGGKGFHVVVPILPEKDWDGVREFAKRVAEGLARDYPAKFTSRMPKARRTGKIFLDWVRNVRGQTAIEVYSTRAREGAPLSVPISWEEAAAGVRSDAFNLENIRQRFESLKKDPWDGFFEIKQRLPG